MTIEDLENIENITEKEINRDEELNSILSENDNIYQLLIKCNLIGKQFTKENIVEKLVEYFFEVIRDSKSYAAATKITSIFNNIPEELAYQLVNKKVVNYIFDYCGTPSNNVDVPYFTRANIYNLLKSIHNVSPWLFPKLKDPDGNNALMYLIKNYELEKYEGLFTEYTELNNPNYDDDGIITTMFKNNVLQKTIMEFLIKDAFVDPSVKNRNGEAFVDFVDFAEEMFNNAKEEKIGK